MHFSMHQLNSHTDIDICVICGSPGHMPNLNASGAKWVFSDPCEFTGNSLNVKKCKKIECSAPLANYPVNCTRCNRYIWRFDMLAHFEREHAGESCPELGVVAEAEKGTLGKRKKSAKSALTKAVLYQLNDDELKLLPIKDFVTKNKERKNNFVGNFGKQSSGRMRRLFGPDNCP